MKGDESGSSEAKAISRLPDFSRAILSLTSSPVILPRDSHPEVSNRKGSKAFLQGSAFI